MLENFLDGVWSQYLRERFHSVDSSVASPGFYQYSVAVLWHGNRALLFRQRAVASKALMLHAEWCHLHVGGTQGPVYHAA